MYMQILTTECHLQFFAAQHHSTDINFEKKMHVLLQSWLSSVLTNVQQEKQTPLKEILLLSRKLSQFCEFNSMKIQTNCFNNLHATTRF